MGSWALALVGLVAAGAPPPPPLAGAQEVWVDTDRLSLGQLMPQLEAPWAQLDLGPAPAPLQRRDYSSQELWARAHAAQLADSLPLPLPERVRVRRQGQSISAPAARAHILQALAAQLPPGAQVRSLTVAQGVVLGAGPLQVQVAASGLSAGRQALVAQLSTHDGVRAMLPAQLDLQLAEAPATARIGRGAQVQVWVVVGSVRLRTLGIAQEAGEVGQTVRVVPDQGRPLRALVLDAATVQVQG